VPAQAVQNQRHEGLAVGLLVKRASAIRRQYSVLSLGGGCHIVETLGPEEVPIPRPTWGPHQAKEFMKA
jgi:hypothetical protein